MMLVDTQTRWSRVVPLSTYKCCLCYTPSTYHTNNGLTPRIILFSQLDLTMLESLHRRLSMVIALGLMLDIIFPWTHPIDLAETTTIIVRTLVIRTNLLISAWGDAISHAQPTATQSTSALQFVTGYKYCTYAYLSVPFMCQLRRHSALWWVPTDEWATTLDLRLQQSSAT